jgi:hypothetical protein
MKQKYARLIGSLIAAVLVASSALAFGAATRARACRRLAAWMPAIHWTGWTPAAVSKKTGDVYACSDWFFGDRDGL